MSPNPCCARNSFIVGKHPRYGDLNRCSVCDNYWAAIGANDLNYYGPGELGAINAVLYNCSLLPAALDHAKHDRG
jgi:hypothetical protein